MISTFLQILCLQPRISKFFLDQIWKQNIYNFFQLLKEIFQNLVYFSYFSALTILRRLSAQVDHLTRKPKDGERSLKEILSILYENDISPFEVNLNDTRNHI